MLQPPLASIRLRVIALLQMLLAAAMLMWPLVSAGRPTVFFDTGPYWWSGRVVVVEGLGIDRGAATPFDQSPNGEVVIHGVAQNPQILSTFAAARSPIYGVFLFVTQQVGSLWLTAAAQALITAGVLYVIWRTVRPTAPSWTYLAVTLGLSALTSLAFFASFAMPDVFAGLSVLVLTTLAFYWDRLGTWMRGGLLGLLALFLTVHVSHLLLALLILPAVLTALWKLGTTWREIVIRGSGLAAVIGIAAVGIIGASPAVRALAGVDTRSPPFLTARLLADGPGRVYLRRACADATPFVLCRFKDRPLDDSDDILWSDSAQKGVFGVSDFNDRLRLEHEQGLFVRSVVLADPVGVTFAALRETGRQLLSFGVDEPLRDPCRLKPMWAWSQRYLRVLIVNAAKCGAGDQPLMPQKLLFGVQGIALVLSAYGLWRMARARHAGDIVARAVLDDSERLVAASMIIVVAILLNAAICGSLSGPFPRYEARLIWLVPALAMLARCGARL